MTQLLLPSGRVDPGWIAAAREAISAREGRAYYKEFFESFYNAAAEDKGASVKQAMRTLEQLWDVDELVAGYLMALLLPDALAAYRHDVSDAIWLYLEHACSPELADALDQVSTKRGKQPKFAAIASKIRRKNAQQR